MSKPAGRNNGKIVTRNQGGGNKLQGLAPGCTAFYIAKSTGQSYYTETGDGRNRNLVLCVNQLGGVGRGRSQFRANADGKRGAGCDDIDDIFTLIHSYTGTPLSIDFYGNYFILHKNISISNVTTYDAITKTDNNINLLEPYLSDICHNLNNIINLINFPGIDLPILSDKIYMLDINNTHTYTGDASYVNVYNSRTFTKYDNSYSIYKPNIINSTDFVYSEFDANALNLYYTNSTTKLGYWYIDASINIRYNTDIETIDISTINITTDYDISLNNFTVCAFNNNFAFTDTSENLIIYFDRNIVFKNKSIIAIPIPITNMSSNNNYGSFSNTNFITSGSHEGTLVMMILDKQIENALIIIKRYNRTNTGSTSLTIPIRNSVYNLLYNLLILGETVGVSIESYFEVYQIQYYNISPNGEYLGLFNYHTRFLEIYKFDGIKYNLHRRKTDINFSNSSTVILINSITNDGTIVSITISNPIDKTALTKIYRLN